MCATLFDMSIFSFGAAPQFPKPAKGRECKARVHRIHQTQPATAHTLQPCNLSAPPACAANLSVTDRTSNSDILESSLAPDRPTNFIMAMQN